jgi:hypothetical protein
MLPSKAPLLAQTPPAQLLYKVTVSTLCAETVLQDKHGHLICVQPNRESGV